MSGIGHDHELVAARSSTALTGSPPACLAPAGMPWTALTDPGCARRHNEDRFRVDPRLGAYALADGMGGYNAGEVASGIAVSVFCEAVGALREAGLPLIDAMRGAIAAAHAGIVECVRARPECLGMGTTLVAAAIDGGRLTVAHVGDSRAYRWRDGALLALTVDHSIGQQMLDRGRMTASQVRRMPARGILTRALGVAGDAPCPDLASVDWRPGDLLMLCTDGLTDRLDDRAIGAALAGSAVPAGPAGSAGAVGPVGTAGLAAIAHALIAAALSAGCADNVTVVLAGGPSPPAGH
jgi:protein phosphatase